MTLCHNNVGQITNRTTQTRHHAGSHKLLTAIQKQGTGTVIKLFEALYIKGNEKKEPLLNAEFINQEEKQTQTALH